MKRRVFAALLAGAMILSLAACGGGNGGGSASSTPGSGSDVSAIAPGGSSSQPDASNPDGSQPDASNPDGSQPDGSAPGEVTLTLNQTNVKLTKAGATFQLRYTIEPDVIDAAPEFTSSDEKVATVDMNGMITAVAPGKAGITVRYDGAPQVIVSVDCDWKVSEPAPKPDPKPDTKPDPKPDASNPGSSSSSGDSSGSGSSGSSSSQVNLSDFYTTTTGKYQFSFMMEADDVTLTNFFAGLSDLSLSQQVIYLCGMSPSPHGDFALVQVSDPKNVDTVKAIFQARIDYMVGDGNGPGGAFYPMEQTMWEENARIAVNGDYVMLIVHPDCDSIVDDFNALF